MSKQFLPTLFLVIFAGWLIPSHACGQDAPKVEVKTTEGNKVKPNHPLPPEREAAVLKFVQENHPELGGLLAHLKENRPADYERAVRELVRVTERLAQIQQKDKELYALELKLWLVQSRLQLLSARLQMGPSDELKAELTAALGEQVDSRAALLTAEREKLQRRVSKLDDDLKAAQADRQKTIDNQLKSILAAATTGKNKAKPASPRPGANKKPNSDSAKPTEPAEAKQPIAAPDTKDRP